MCIGVTPEKHSYTPYSNTAFLILFRFSFVGLSVLFICLDLSMVRFLAGGCLQLWLTTVRNVCKRTSGSAADPRSDRSRN